MTRELNEYKVTVSKLNYEKVYAENEEEVRKYCEQLMRCEAFDSVVDIELIGKYTPPPVDPKIRLLKALMEDSGLHLKEAKDLCDLHNWDEVKIRGILNA